MRTILFVLASLLAGVAACGDDASPGTDAGHAGGGDAALRLDASDRDASLAETDGGGADGSAGDRWAAICDTRVTMCGDPLPDCLRVGDCYRPWVLTSVFSSYADCIESMGCMSSDDTCFGMAASSTPTTPEGQAFADQCNSLCPGDEICNASFASAVQPAVLRAYMVCLSRPSCSSILDCWDSARPGACG